jgi:hypothetical protein
MEQKKGQKLVKYYVKKIKEDFGYTAPEALDWKVGTRLSNFIMDVEAINKEEDPRIPIESCYECKFHGSSDSLSNFVNGQCSLTGTNTHDGDHGVLDDCIIKNYRIM